jgi:Right handed beta helix region
MNWNQLFSQDQRSETAFAFLREMREIASWRRWIARALGKGACLAVLSVGPGEQYATLLTAVNAARNGDTIQVRPGTYINDFAIVTKNLTIAGAGGMAHFTATVPPPNGRAILVTAGDITIDRLEFSGAKVPNSNGAGIRFDRGHLVIKNSYFHDNQMGLLAAGDRNGSVTIEKSEFSHSLVADGSSDIGHNLYIGGPLGAVTVKDSYFHDAFAGHNIKSRALNTAITGTRIFDLSGSVSYSIDLPNGGNALIANNVIQQGPNSANAAIIAYAAETASPYEGSRLTISENTIINQLRFGSPRGLANHSSTITASIVGNRIYGLAAANIASGPNTQSRNATLTVLPALDTSHPWAAGP